MHIISKASRGGFALIESMARAVGSSVRKPWLLVPAALLLIITTGLLFLFQEPLVNLLVDALFLENLPEAPLSVFPVLLLAMYPTEFAVVGLLLFVFTFLGVGTGFVYSKLANDSMAGNPSVGRAISATLESRGNILALGVFFFVLALFFGALLWIMLVAAQMYDMVAALFLLAVFALLLYVFVKLAFTVASMAIENLKAKDALVKSWVFTTNRFWRVLLFLVAVAITYGIILNAGSFIDSLVAEPILGGILFGLFWAFGVAYSNMAIAFYFLKHETVK
jgi:hypothetical protein